MQSPVKNKTVVIHQPDFLPYLGFFHRLLNIDLFVLLDNVQFMRKGKNSWNNRDKIKTPYGEKWITISIQKNSKDALINQIKFSANNKWREDCLNQVKQNYLKSVHFDEIYGEFTRLFEYQCQYLYEFNIQSIQMLMRFFDIELETVLASTLNAGGKSNKLLVNILNETGAKKYLSGTGARAYYDPVPFEKAGIEVEFQEFNHPVYPQMHGKFIPYLSAIDILFNCGIKESRKILRKN